MDETSDYRGEFTGKREYFEQLETALHSWGKLNGQVSVLAEARDIVHQIEKTNGPITGAFVPSQTRPYVAVMFAGDEKRAGAWIHVGYVDHLVPLPGATEHAEKKYFTTRMTSWRGDASGGAKEKSINTVPCVNCPGMQVPVTGQCGCGWRPDGQ